MLAKQNVLFYVYFKTVKYCHLINEERLSKLYSLVKSLCNAVLVQRQDAWQNETKWIRVQKYFFKATLLMFSDIFFMEYRYFLCTSPFHVFNPKSWLFPVFKDSGELKSSNLIHLMSNIKKEYIYFFNQGTDLSPRK